MKRPGRWYRRLGVAVLFVVAVTGAVLSWSSLYEAASLHLGQSSPYVTIRGAEVNAVGAVFSVLLDGLILAASLLYVAGVKAQRPVAGWRAAAHVAIAGTVLANIAAATTVADIGWHVVPPAVWALVVELTARDILGELREVRATVAADRISWKLWVTSPAEQARTTWRMLRTLEPSAQVARVEADRCAATAIALAMRMPGLANARRRRRITRRMWAGTLSPADVFAAAEAGGTPDQIVALALRSVLPGESIRSSVPVSRPDPVESTVDRVEPGRVAVVDPIESSPVVDPVESIGVEHSIRSIRSGGGVALASVPDRVEESTDAGAVGARADDVARLRQAIRDGAVSVPLRVEHVRTHLRIGPRYAKAAVAAVEAAGTEDEAAEA